MHVQGDHVDAARILLHHKAPVDEVSTVPDLPLPPKQHFSPIRFLPLKIFIQFTHSQSCQNTTFLLLIPQLTLFKIPHFLPPHPSIEILTVINFVLTI